MRTFRKIKNKGTKKSVENENNNNNNNPENRKYWLDVQWGIVSSHGERYPL